MFRLILNPNNVGVRNTTKDNKLQTEQFKTLNLVKLTGYETFPFMPLYNNMKGSDINCTQLTAFDRFLTFFLYFNT